MAGKGIRTYEQEAASNVALGQAGSIHVAGTALVTAANGVFVAITFLEDTTFATSDTEGLIAEDAGLFPSSVGTSSKISANGVVTDSETFPKGITIFGRWTKFTLATGKVIAYIG
tara:strand:+ start:1316 stop:1660 length:345 start_codon:yes stop_codon:yes gene_type:complete